MKAGESRGFDSGSWHKRCMSWRSLGQSAANWAKCNLALQVVVFSLVQNVLPMGDHVYPEVPSAVGHPHLVQISFLEEEGLLLPLSMVLWVCPLRLLIPGKRLGRVWVSSWCCCGGPSHPGSCWSRGKEEQGCGMPLISAIVVLEWIGVDSWGGWPSRMIGCLSWGIGPTDGSRHWVWFLSSQA